MDFNYQNMKVRDILGYNNKQLCIPRYQRDYSWEKEEIEEFLNDILLQISVSKEGELCTGEYFFGTILLAGSFSDTKKELEVIDGQQRVTTMTIFLSVLAKCFYEINNVNLGDSIWKYIIKTDDEGDSYKALNNDTTDNYFAYLIQMKEEEKDECELKDEEKLVDEEQERIKNVYDYFTNILKEDQLRQKMKKIMEESNLDQIKYVDILKAIRTQLLDSTIICLVTKDNQSANSIFEILNGKGKQLDSIDLIKNNIFSKVNKISPRDNANEIWKKIKKELVSRKKYIEFSTFYRHYWISKYKKVKDDQLYKEFTKTIKEENYISFLTDLYSSSKQYMKIINPNDNDYNNRKEYKYIVEYLKYLNEYFNIKQIRVLLLALFEAKFDKGILSNKKLKEILIYLHGFHFVYNALCTKRSNAFESKYSKFAIKLNNAQNKSDANIIIDELRSELDKLFPNYNEFEKVFIKLEFSKEKNKSNMLSKYVLNNLEKGYSGSDIEPINGSVEHILGESKDKNTLNIGNLILLEMNLNRKAEDKKFLEKLPIYKESSYSYVKAFLDKYSNTEKFDEKIINERAKDMAKLYYESILKREVQDSID